MASNQDVVAEQTDKPPVKRSFFKNRPAWAASPTKPSRPAEENASSSSATDMFSRSSETLARIRQNRELQREYERQEEQNRLLSAEERHKAKRRRILEQASNETVSEDEDDNGNAKSPGKSKSVSASPSKKLDLGQTSTSAMDIDSESDNLNRSSPKKTHSARQRVTTRSAARSVLVEESDSDEDLAALEERIKQRTLANERLDEERRKAQSQPVEPKTERTPPPSTEPVVSLFIHSDLPHTNPLLVQRRINQPLGVVKIAWCTRQGFEDAAAETLILTWREQRIYSTTTCKSLGIDVDSDGEIYIRGDRQPPGPENSQLAMEVMTVAELKKRRQEKEAAKQARLQALKGEEVAVAADETPVQIRITLKARGYEDYKLKVKATTKFEQVLSVWKMKRDVPEETEAILIFDGDQLQESQTMADTEISDMDSVEVHVK